MNLFARRRDLARLQDALQEKDAEIDRLMRHRETLLDLLIGRAHGSEIEEVRPQTTAEVQAQSRIAKEIGG